MNKNQPKIYHSDLIEDVLERISWMENKYPKMIANNKLSEGAAQRNIQVQRKILKVLNKYKRNLQPDMDQD